MVLSDHLIEPLQSWIFWKIDILGLISCDSDEEDLGWCPEIQLKASGEYPDLETTDIVHSFVLKDAEIGPEAGLTCFR